MRGRAELEREVAVPEAFLSLVLKLKHGPWYSVVKLVLRGVHKEGKVLSVWEVMLGRSVSFSSFPAGDQHLLALLARRKGISSQI